MVGSLSIGKKEDRIWFNKTAAVRLHLSDVSTHKTALGDLATEDFWFIAAIMERR